MLSCIWMLNKDVDSHSVVSQLEVAHISMRVWGMVVRKLGNPSSGLKFSMDVEKSSPERVSNDSSSQRVSKYVSS